MDDVVRTEATFDLPHAVTDLWPILSKTDWLNRALGLPPVSYALKPASHGGSEIRAGASLYGLPLEWIESPFEWIEPEFYQVRRNYPAGPWVETILGMRLAFLSPRLTRITVFNEVTPRNVLGTLLAKTVVAPKSAQDMQRIMGHVSSHLSNRVEPSLPNLQVTPNRPEAFDAGMRLLMATPAAGDLVNRFGQWLKVAPDVALLHIRPWVVAREWMADKWKVLSLLLHATRSGLLELSWEALCPNCRTSRQPQVRSLANLQSTVHCDVCQIRYEAKFDQSVELKFAINPLIRPVENQTYCLAGPGGSPHVISQANVAPGEDRSWHLPAGAGRIRLRSPQVRDMVEIPPELCWGGGGFMVRADTQGFAFARPESGQESSEVRLQNRLGHPVQFVFERLAWSEDILTAAQVTSWQDFKDLFPEEVVSPHEQLMVGSQVLLFTDLKGATALYNQIGDAPAYVMVRDHFVALQRVIKEHRGSVVKTIGDAVMAVFSNMEDGLNAVVALHGSVAALIDQPRHTNALTLKASLHSGPCLAVNANGRLDFFGSTVNLAARMLERSAGRDLILEDGVIHRPEVAAWVHRFGVKTEALELQLPGFERPHKVWRLLLNPPS